ncbi:MAG: glycosyl transferase family 2 [Candidatus Lindowbacteria bacterium]|nr:glycosyl transferase family 2 [Candidatus Lindowbacteria bacterium]
MIVGIPSYNNAQTIGYVARAAAEGVAKYFPDAKALLMNSDGGSNDGTRDSFVAAVSKHPHKLSTRYVGTPGKGSALKAIFEATSILGARACVLVDSDLRSITPEWIRWLAEPILKDNAGYVTPLYLRHKYDGTITNSLAYPFTRALYGKRVRQPIGGDFGVSRKLAESYLEKNVWGTGAAKYGIDIFMTTTAINEGFDIRQANLGAKIHDAKDPAVHLAPMFRQVVGTMFSLMRKYEDKWVEIKGSHPVPAAGPPLEANPEPVPVTLSALTQRLKEGVRANKKYWAGFLSNDIISGVEQLVSLAETEFRFPAQLWVRIVYEFAAACNSGKLDPGEALDSLTPLYFGRTAGFIAETERMDSKQAERVIEIVAELFEKEKPYLLSLWEKK